MSGDESRAMKVTITETEILVDVGEDELPLTDRTLVHLCTCRIASHEVCAWAVKRLGEEMEKSVAFYRTHQATDKIVME